MEEKSQRNTIKVGQKVLVTTEYRGVFFGTLAEINMTERWCVLTDARNCLYWPSSEKGFVGLAVAGPLDGARVGPAVESINLAGVTSIARCTDEAARRWEAGPWK